MPVPAAVAAIVGLLGGVLKLSENPFIAWFLVIAVLMLDSTIAGIFHYSGMVGMLITFVLDALLPAGAHIVITSFQVMVLVAITPVIMFALQKSVQHTR